MKDSVCDTTQTHVAGPPAAAPLPRRNLIQTKSVATTLKNMLGQPGSMAQSQVLGQAAILPGAYVSACRAMPHVHGPWMVPASRRSRRRRWTLAAPGAALHLPLSECCLPCTCMWVTARSATCVRMYACAFTDACRRGDVRGFTTAWQQRSLADGAAGKPVPPPLPTTTIHTHTVVVPHAHARSGMVWPATRSAVACPCGPVHIQAAREQVF